MIAKQNNKFSLLVGSVLLTVCSVTLANNEESAFAIPMVDNAQVFANYTDELPVVLNYYTSASEEQIINFYRQNFGESISQEHKRDRLTLTYAKETKIIRVIISQQNSKRQVDVMVEQAQL